MPVSEDEFERPVQMAPNQTTMSKAEQRKSNKPIMEKRRRARINHCLNELKTLILDAMKKDPARHSKLEKADILEMTVKHLQQIQRQQLATAVATDPGVVMRFKSGFDECAAEVSRYIGKLEGVDSGVKQRLTAHLHRCVSSLQQISAFPHQNMFSALSQNCDKGTIVLPAVPAIPGDVNNNSNQNGERIQIPGGLQLIPSRLPTGELALLVPNSNHISTLLNGPSSATAFQFPPNAGVSLNTVLSPTLGGAVPSSTNHASAFTAVNKTQDYPSPTSTADIIKKESNASEKDEFKGTSYASKLVDHGFNQNYKFKVTETLNGDQDYKSSKSLLTGNDLIEPSQSFVKLNPFGHGSTEGMDYEQPKISQKASSSSFQKNVADSTTSFMTKDEVSSDSSGFKPFQVEIPNSHLKAHISIPRTQEDNGAPTTFQIQHKPNPNFTINPNKLYQKSPNKFSRCFVTSETNCTDTIKTEMGFVVKREETNVDSLSYASVGCSLPLMASSSSISSPTLSAKLTEIPYPKTGKRPLSPETSSANAFELPSKTPRISLNVTLTEDTSKDEGDHHGLETNRCKRISVIVEDSSKSNVKENGREMTVSVSTQKDMWRPW